MVWTIAFRYIFVLLAFISTHLLHHSFQLLLRLLANGDVGVEGSFDPLAEPGGVHVGCCVAKLEKGKMGSRRPWQKAGDKNVDKASSCAQGKTCGGGKLCGSGRCAVTTCVTCCACQAYFLLPCAISTRERGIKTT